MKKFLSLIVLFIFVFITGCARKEEPMVFEFQKYNDPVVKYSLLHPKNWVLSMDEGTVRIFSSADAYTKFLDPSAPAEIGALFLIEHKKINAPIDLAAFVDSVKAEEIEMIPSYQTEEDITIDGTPAKKLTYSVIVAEGMTLKGVKALLVTDTMTYQISFKSFNEKFDSFKPAFDTLLASFKLPKPAGSPDAVNENLPSETFTSFDHTMFSMSYPENFDNSFPAKRGNILYSVLFSGFRKDCTIQIDVLPSQNLSVEKVFEQNKVNYANTKRTSETTIGGLKAMFIDYSPMAQINSRAYFLVQGDKVFRVTLNWFQPEQANYLPIFERAVATLKLK